MPVSIGGSPGTGSSLLRQMLNRHPAVYCGPETNVFAFPALFDDWDKYRSRIPGGRRFASKLISPSVRPVHSTRLAGREQSWDQAELKDLVARSRSFREFCDGYFMRPCRIYGKKFWAEKTPANVLTFTRFLTTWDNSVVVHMTRDPSDTITSLMNRGLPLFEAVARYLFNCAYALKSRDDTRYCAIKYEILVTDPEAALTPLLTRIGLSFDPVMVRPGNPLMTETSRMKGWKYSETDRPGTESINRFEQAPENIRQAILGAIALVHLRPEFAHTEMLDVTDVAACARSMAYPLPDTTSKHASLVREQLRRQEKTFRRQRMLKNNWWYERSRPVMIANT